MAYITFKKDCYFGFNGETIMVQENHAADMIRRGFAYDPNEKPAVASAAAKEETAAAPTPAPVHPNVAVRQQKNEELAARSKRS